MDKNPAKIKKSAMIEYVIDEKAKTKIISSSNDARKIAEAAVANKEAKVEKLMNSSYTSQRIKGQEAFLGYAWSYAKDLVIAGKTMEDMEELHKIAKFIYDNIGEQLKNEQNPFNN